MTYSNVHITINETGEIRRKQKKQKKKLFRLRPIALLLLARLTLIQQRLQRHWRCTGTTDFKEIAEKTVLRHTVTTTTTTARVRFKELFKLFQVSSVSTICLSTTIFILSISCIWFWYSTVDIRDSLINRSTDQILLRSLMDSYRYSLFVKLII